MIGKNVEISQPLLLHMLRRLKVCEEALLKREVI